MKFRPCIDLHQGKVKQIIGSSLRDGAGASENFVSSRSPAFYSDLYFQDGWEGGHVILLGPGNEKAAQEALGQHPNFLQVGGGIHPENAGFWLDAGAQKVIVTSYLFTDGELDPAKVKAISQAVGKERLVLDLSCIPQADGFYHIATNRWQTICRTTLQKDTFQKLAPYCSEFLIHAVQVEGKQSGIDETLVQLLANLSPLPCVYAGGIRCPEDLQRIYDAGKGRIDYTIGSALDLFGGKGIRYQDLKTWHPIPPTR